MDPQVLERRRALKTLLDKYTHSFSTLKKPSELSPTNSGKAVVLLSGSTGAFGSNVLAALASSSKVNRVYGISRPNLNQPDVRERHAMAFRREGIDVSLLESPKIRLIEGDLATEQFGLDHQTFEEASLTHIIQNGWQVNFRRPVSEFESNIRSTRNCVDFALTAGISSTRPVKVIFISSLGVFRNTNPQEPQKVWPEENLSEPDSALGLGYTEAKWVCENILEQAARHTHLRPTVVRLGQLVGGPSGYWSEHEWFAALVKSSLYFGMLPNVPGILSWNSLHVAAQALVDMLNTDEPYLNLVHPRPVAWTAVMSILSRKFRVPLVHINDWMPALHRTLVQAESAASKEKNISASRKVMRKEFRRNPAARMVGYFIQEHESCKGKPLSPEQQTVWTPLVRCEKAIAASQILQDSGLPQIGETDVDLWIANWRQIGFLENEAVGGVTQKSHL